LHNFADLTVEFDYIQMIAGKYLNYGYYRECLDCCSKVVSRYESFAVPMDYPSFFQFLFTLYVASYYADRTNAPEVLRRLRLLIDTIPTCKDIYLANQGFYDAQFSFVQAI
jgi:hypothetical protein